MEHLQEKEIKFKIDTADEYFYQVGNGKKAQMWQWN